MNECERKRVREREIETKTHINNNLDLFLMRFNYTTIKWERVQSNSYRFCFIRVGKRKTFSQLLSELCDLTVIILFYRVRARVRVRVGEQQRRDKEESLWKIE